MFNQRKKVCGCVNKFLGNEVTNERVGMRGCSRGWRVERLNECYEQTDDEEQMEQLDIPTSRICKQNNDRHQFSEARHLTQSPSGSVCSKHISRSDYTNKRQKKEYSRSLDAPATSTSCLCCHHPIEKPYRYSTNRNFSEHKLIPTHLKSERHTHCNYSLDMDNANGDGSDSSSNELEFMNSNCLCSHDNVARAHECSVNEMKDCRHMRKSSCAHKCSVRQNDCSDMRAFSSGRKTSTSPMGCRHMGTSSMAPENFARQKKYCRHEGISASHLKQRPNPSYDRGKCSTRTITSNYQGKHYTCCNQSNMKQNYGFANGGITRNQMCLQNTKPSSNHLVNQKDQRDKSTGGEYNIVVGELDVNTQTIEVTFEDCGPPDINETIPKRIRLLSPKHLCYDDSLNQENLQDISAYKECNIVVGELDVSNQIVEVSLDDGKELNMNITSHPITMHQRPSESSSTTKTFNRSVQNCDGNKIKENVIKDMGLATVEKSYRPLLRSETEQGVSEGVESYPLSGKIELPSETNDIKNQPVVSEKPSGSSGTTTTNRGIDPNTIGSNKKNMNPNNTVPKQNMPNDMTVLTAQQLYSALFEPESEQNLFGGKKMKIRSGKLDINNLSLEIALESAEESDECQSTICKNCNKPKANNGIAENSEYNRKKELTLNDFVLDQANAKRKRPETLDPSGNKNDKRHKLDRSDIEEHIFKKIKIKVNDNENDLNEKYYPQQDTLLNKMSCGAEKTSSNANNNFVLNEENAPGGSKGNEDKSNQYNSPNQEKSYKDPTSSPNLIDLYKQMHSIMNPEKKKQQFAPQKIVLHGMLSSENPADVLKSHLKHIFDQIAPNNDSKEVQQEKIDALIIVCATSNEEKANGVEENTMNEENVEYSDSVSIISCCTDNDDNAEINKATIEVTKCLNGEASNSDASCEIVENLTPFSSALINLEESCDESNVNMNYIADDSRKNSNPAIDEAVDTNVNESRNEFNVIVDENASASSNQSIASLDENINVNVQESGNESISSLQKNGNANDDEISNDFSVILDKNVSANVSKSGDEPDTSVAEHVDESSNEFRPPLENNVVANVAESNNELDAAVAESVDANVGETTNESNTTRNDNVDANVEQSNRDFDESVAGIVDANVTESTNESNAPLGDSAAANVEQSDRESDVLHGGNIGPNSENGGGDLNEANAQNANLNMTVENEADSSDRRPSNQDYNLNNENTLSGDNANVDEERNDDEDTSDDGDTSNDEDINDDEHTSDDEDANDDEDNSHDQNTNQNGDANGDGATSMDTNTNRNDNTTTNNVPNTSNLPSLPETSEPYSENLPVNMEDDSEMPLRLVLRPNGLLYPARLNGSRTNANGRVELYMQYVGFSEQYADWVPETLVFSEDNLHEALVKMERKRKHDHVHDSLISIYNRSISKIVEHKNTTFSAETGIFFIEHIRVVKKVQYGKWKMKAWCNNSYPLDLNSDSKIYICQFCLQYMLENAYESHRLLCQEKKPPGNKIYEKNNIQVYEIDGAKDTSYCQLVSLLGKLYIEHKKLSSQMNQLMFYVLCEVDGNQASYLVGYFAKEKEALNNNLAVLAVLPPFQAKGYGKFLIDLSYKISVRDGIYATPQRPFSALGKISYFRYWAYKIVSCFHSRDIAEAIRVEELSERTGLALQDVLYTLSELKILRIVRDKIFGYVTPRRLFRLHLFPQCHKPKLLVDEMHLNWSSSLHHLNPDQIITNHTDQVNL